jgi:hypothetical protein
VEFAGGANRFAKEGRAFYPFGKGDAQSSALPEGSPCAQCHVAKGAFDGTFAQFYANIRGRVKS